MRSLSSIARRPLFSVVTACAIAGALASCVTVNVNIPEGEIQQASDDYVKELYDAKEGGKTTATGTSVSTGTATSTATGTSSLKLLQTNSPKATEIKARMKARRPELKDKKAAGLLGESNDGVLVLKGAVSGDQALAVKKLVDDENTDRKALFKEIGRQSHQSSAGMAVIEKSFARAFQDHSPTGTWVQDEDSSWSQKQ